MSYNPDDEAATAAMEVEQRLKRYENIEIGTYLTVAMGAGRENAEMREKQCDLCIFVRFVLLATPRK